MRPDPRLLVALAAALTLLACRGNTGPAETTNDPAGDTAPSASLGDTASIPLGAVRSADGGRVMVRFVAKLSDSRCPANALCMWEGDASVRLHIRTVPESRDVVLHTRLDPRWVHVGGYTVVLVGLWPYPGTWPDTVAAPAHTALVSITRP